MQNLPVMLFIVAFVAIAGLTMWSSARERKASAAREAGWHADAQRRGWQLEVERPGQGETWRYRGNTSGTGWRTESSWVRGSSDHQGRTYTRWWAEGVSGKGIVVVMPLPRGGARFQIGDPKGDVGDNPIARFALKQYLKSLTGSLPVEPEQIEDCHAFPGGSAQFRERFHVLTSDDAMADKLLSGDAQAALLAWVEQWERNPKRTAPLPGVLYGSEGLVLGFGQFMSDPAEIEQIAQLGATLASAPRRLES